jgi:hypothetical protein
MDLSTQFSIGGGKTKVTFNIMDLLKAYTILSALLPAIKGFILSLNDEDMPGDQKKAAVTTFVETTVRSTAQYTKQLPEELIQIILQIAPDFIEGLVQGLKKTAAWVKKTVHHDDTVPPAPPAMSQG